MIELVSFPAIYDTAFQFRRANRVIDFIEQCVTMYSDIPVHSVLDIACGTGHYTREFARRSYLAYGVDINAETCEYACAKADMEALTLHVTCADMIDFSLPACCDLAVNFFDSLTYLLHTQLLAKHFEIVAELLHPGGLYIVEVGVVDLFSNHNVEEVWTERRRNLSVTTSYFRGGRIYPENSTFIEECSFQVTCREHAAFWHAKFSKLALHFEVFEHIIRQTEHFTLLACYEDFKPGAYLVENEPPWRVIAILQHIG